MNKLTSLCKKSAVLLMALMVVTLLLPAAEANAASSYVKTLSLTKTTASVKAGKSTTLYATVTKAGSASTKVTVSSSNKAVATVSVGSPSSGKSKISIKGVKKGKATITVKTAAKNKSGAYLKKTVAVTVNYADVTGLSVSPTSKTLYKGESVTIKPTVTPSKANQGVTYSSSNTAVATVTTSGTVKGVKAGTATITVKTKGKNSSGSYVKKTVKITVYDYVTSLSVSPTSKSIKIGDSVTIKPTVAPSTANQSVTYTSSDTTVATVSSSGKVTGKKAGTATISVKTKGTDTYGTQKIKKVEISVLGGNGFTKSDYSIQKEMNTRYIEFTFNKDTVTKEELEAQGYHVEGNTASMNVSSPKWTFTFTKLPCTLEEVKQIALNDEYGFGPVAAGIAMIAGQNQEITRFNYNTTELYKVIDYLNSPKFGIYAGTAYDLLSKPMVNKTQMCYFQGATPSNGYTPTKPYKVTLELGPYYIPARETDINYPNGTPARYMILYSTTGDDSERYCDVFHSGDGNWYIWDNSWTHLTAQVKTPSTGGGW